MLTVNFWHLSLPIAYAAIWCGFVLAIITGTIISHRRNIPAVSTIADIFWTAIIASRLGFVLLYFEHYRHSLLSIIDIGDGGFSWFSGIAGAMLAILYKLIRHPQLRQPMLPILLSAVLGWGSVMALASLSAADTDPAFPQASVLSLDGTPLQLADIPSGKPVVINLWASWCPPCVREMPVLAKAQKTHSDVTFVFVNQGETAAAITSFLSRKKLDINNVVIDSDYQMRQETGSNGLPTTLFYNARGERVHVHIGELSKATLAHGMSFFRSAQR